MSDGLTDKRSQSETVFTTAEIAESTSKIREKVLHLLISYDGTQDMSVRALRELADKIENAAWSVICGIKR